MERKKQKGVTKWKEENEGKKKEKERAKQILRSHVFQQDSGGMSEWRWEFPPPILE